MATANEIVARLKAGEIVYLNSEDAGEFMLECYRHSIRSPPMKLRYAHGRCRMEITSEGRKQIEQSERG